MQRFPCLLILVLILLGTVIAPARDLDYDGDGAPFETIPLQDMPVPAATGEKPQSKLWFHDAHWRAVLSAPGGTKLWRLEGRNWVESLPLSDSVKAKADVVAVGSLAHVLLYEGPRSRLISLEYDPAGKKYHPWVDRISPTAVPLESASETATIGVDSSGRMWLASDGETEVHVRWSDPPYTKFSPPLTLASGIAPDDICALTIFPDGGVGVLWSNQRTKRYGFRKHAKGAAAEDWSPDEVPAGHSAISWQDGMADDHLNWAVASDGTLYAAVKTSYDTPGYPLIALLVRRPSGQWDKLYEVDDEGTRPIVLLREKENRLFVVYTDSRENAIVCKTSNADRIAFGPRRTLIGGAKRVNNVTGTKQGVVDETVILARDGDVVRGARMEWDVSGDRGNQ